jgi:hypothetical protein
MIIHRRPRHEQCLRHNIAFVSIFIQDVLVTVSVEFSTMLLFELPANQIRVSHRGIYGVVLSATAQLEHCITHSFALLGQKNVRLLLIVNVNVLIVAAIMLC